MDADTFARLLRSATEDDVIKALDGAHVEQPLARPTDLLEFYNRMIDVMLDAGADAELAASQRIPPGFGSTD